MEKKAATQEKPANSSSLKRKESCNGVKNFKKHRIMHTFNSLSHFNNVFVQQLYLLLLHYNLSLRKWRLYLRPVFWRKWRPYAMRQQRKMHSGVRWPKAG